MPNRVVLIIVIIAGSVLGTRAGTARGAGPAGSFDVVVVGGSTAAFAAAVAAAEEGANVALLEPTDWVGGQLTASGVPAVDEAWHKVIDPISNNTYDVAAVARRPENRTPNLRAMLDATGNPGGGWVSRFCFLPGPFIARHLAPLEAGLAGRLAVYRETVPKGVERDGATGRIVAVRAIHRAPRSGVARGGYDRPPSEDLADWYDPTPSARFGKETLRFEADARPGHSTIFLDATEWGEILALADLPYLQGVEASDGGLDGDDRLGQATVFGVAERIAAVPEPEPTGPAGVEHLGFGTYRDRPDAWGWIWTYRRLRGAGPKPAVGDITLQNWGYSDRDGEGGNDEPFGYLFRTRAEARAERADWRGGVDIAVLAAAERRALAWHEWFKAHTPPPLVPGQVVIDREAFGTATGLAKVPYVRDTRRSIGIDGFLLRGADFVGSQGAKTGRIFPDRIAIGAYASDIHPLAGRAYPPYLREARETLPFTVPFRSLTHDNCPNLLVAGKTMAQSFLANAATRLHPIEWSTGTAAGVAAAMMARNGWTARQAYDRIDQVQAAVRRKTPIDWTIDGRIVPGP